MLMRHGATIHIPIYPELVATPQSAECACGSVTWRDAPGATRTYTDTCRRHRPAVPYRPEPRPA